MNAVRIHAYGGPETLIYEDAPVPQPKAGEVLIRIHAAAVNPVDWKARGGYLDARFPGNPFPLILGAEIAGVVEAIGASVSGLAVGDAVWAMPGALTGGYAEYATLPASEVARKPASLDFVQAAALPVGYLTAFQALVEQGNLSAGQRVLIHAAAGGVGSVAVQIAKARGAFVYGTASARNHDFLRERGVDVPIDYATRRFEDAVEGGVDVVFDTVGGETQTRSFDALAPGGILVSVVDPPDENVARAKGVRAALTWVRPDAAQLGEAAALADAGKLKPFVESVLPLSHAKTAHEQSQTGHVKGKIVLTPES